MTEKTDKNSFARAHDEALRLACDALLNTDIHQQCRNAGAEIREASAGAYEAEILFLNRTVRISLPACSFHSDDSGSTVPLWEKIILLHYLARCSEAGLSGTLIDYRHVQDGAPYFSTFEKRSTKIILKGFASAEDMLPEAAAPLNPQPAPHGDVGIRIQALPKVPLYFILWKGDDEFPPNCRILFDESIQLFLSAEDIAVLCQQISLFFLKNKPA